MPCEQNMQAPGVAMGACFPGWKVYWMRSLRDVIVLLFLTLAMVWGLAFCFVPDAVRSITASDVLSSVSGDAGVSIAFKPRLFWNT
ncbi:MAG: hypothetical protein HQL64_15170 [Magnetococcales bacterium]|nr:hypothetical protein [Magnetococcales bacterium]